MCYCCYEATISKLDFLEVRNILRFTGALMSIILKDDSKKKIVTKSELSRISIRILHASLDWEVGLYRWYKSALRIIVILQIWIIWMQVPCCQKYSILYTKTEWFQNSINRLNGTELFIERTHRTKVFRISEEYRINTKNDSSRTMSFVSLFDIPLDLRVPKCNVWGGSSSVCNCSLHLFNCLNEWIVCARKVCLKWTKN